MRERIQQTGYAAKTDHLQRLMQRSRQRRIANRLGWRSLVVRTAGIIQLLSILSHFCWTVSVILSGLKRKDSGKLAGDIVSLGECLWVLGLEQQVPPACAQQFQALAGWALLLGFTSLWWTPKWQDKLQGNEGRLCGLQRYYSLQAIALSIRFATWFVSEGFSTDSKLLWTLHVVSSPILTVLYTASLASVRVDNTPLVSWHMEISPLVGEQISDPNEQSWAPSLRDEYCPPAQFPISSLAPAQERGQVPLPPMTPAWSETDEMEWEPSQEFKPTSYAERYPQPAVKPSPFHGRLPPAPTSRILSRNSQAIPPPKDSIGLAPGHFDKPSNTVALPPQSEEPQFAPPKFFPANDHVTDTGLESIFGKVFSLGDETADTEATLYNQDPNNTTAHVPFPTSQSAYATTTTSSKVSELHLASAFLFLVLLAGWLTLGYLDIVALQLKLIMTTSVGGGAALLLLATVASAEQRTSQATLYLLETVVAAILAASQYQGQAPGAEKLSQLTTALMAVMISQEIILSALATSTPTKSHPSRPLADFHQAQAPRTRNLPYKDSEPRKSNKKPQKDPTTYSIPQSDGPSSSFNPQPPFLAPRPRTDSIDSATSDSDTSSVVSTITSASTFTPGFRNREMSGGTIPGLGFGSLRLDDLGGDGGTSRTRMSMRNLRSGNAGRYGMDMSGRGGRKF